VTGDRGNILGWDEEVNKASLPHPTPKYFLFHPSHQIFRRMYGTLNVGKKDN
jgi:hypothetical protein